MTDQQPGGTPPVPGWPPADPAAQPTEIAPAAPAWTPPPVAQPPAWPSPPAQPPQTPAWPPAAQPTQGSQQPEQAGRAAPSSGWQQPQAAAEPRRTSFLVVLAGIFLLLAGILTLGMGGLILAGGLLFPTVASSTDLAGVVPPELLSGFGGVVAIVGGVIAAWALLEIVGAIGMFAHRGWGRAIGFVVGLLGLGFTGLSLVSALNAPPDAGASVGFVGAFVAGYALTLVAVVSGGAHFRRA